MADFPTKYSRNLTSQTMTFSVNRTGLQILRDNFVQPQEIQEDTPVAQSILGTPVYDNIVFQGGKYKTLEGDEITYAGGPNSENFRIDNVLMTLSQSKNIVTTALQGRDGTIKEFMSNGDYVINIAGSLIGRNENGDISDIGNQYPEDDVEELINILTVPQEIVIFSSIFRRLGIKYVVVTDFSFTQRAGFRNIQDFTIDLLSDNPVETT